ncbi:MAG: hypothetical protein LCH37_07555 [Bacteroidetes bacterium]|nr:hypothetical protein [Bacteroidota bacterium]MCK6612467.1 hypothetical protein [Bacteroidia bacterium]
MKNTTYWGFLLGVVLLLPLQSWTNLNHAKGEKRDTLIYCSGFIQDSIPLVALKVYTYPDSSSGLEMLRKIEVSLPGKTFETPIPDPISVKNFSVTDIAITNNQLQLKTSRGGGNFLFTDEFYFVYSGKTLVLQQIEHVSYGPNQPLKRRTVRPKKQTTFEQFLFQNFLD